LQAVDPAARGPRDAPSFRRRLLIFGFTL